MNWTCDRLISLLAALAVAVTLFGAPSAQAQENPPSPPTDAAEEQEPQVTGDVLSGSVPPEPLPDAPPEPGEETAPTVRSDEPIAFKYGELPPLPQPLRGAFVGVQNGTLLLAGGLTEAGEVSNAIYVSPPPAEGETRSWTLAGELETPRAFGAVASSPAGIELIGGEVDGQPVATVTRLQWSPETSQLQQTALPDLPTSISRAAALRFGGDLYVAGGRDAGGNRLRRFLTLRPGEAEGTFEWIELEPWPQGEVTAPVLVEALEHLYLFGGRAGQEEAAPVAYRWSERDGWTKLATADQWPAGAAAAQVGPSHVFVVGGTNDDGSASTDILAYHTITDTWFTAGTLDRPAPTDLTAISLGNQIALLGTDAAFMLAPQPVMPYFPWFDYAIVILYLLAMLAMGWFFVRRKNTDDYFRGGRHIPWWATGMSLFATGASAISLMAMPGKSYATNWNYFAISIFSLLVLPVSMFLLAPLVRRLNIATANEYLERRFGVVARLFASVIYMFTQVATRFAAIMLLPAIAFNAITGVDVWVAILVMGLITTLYTFLGGLEAVIWTDTVQGFVMCAAVAGCLILALTRIDGGVGTAIDTSYGLGKLDVFDWTPSLLHVTSLAFLINTVVATLGGISDQNYVQRVQATPTLKDAQRAVATQLAVAVPINVLLFGLGTALWLFYRSQPEMLNPVMETDGVFPFFVAQQLPPGISGLVMAALLAATMSTVSSAICATSDLGVNDFYRRFSRRATDRSSLILGRVLMGVVGILGTGIALILAGLGSASVWDLALRLTGLISNGIIGLFWLGLLTRRANEVGALIGVVFGMLTVLYLQTSTEVTFLVYQAAGGLVAIVVGYLASLLIPMRPKETAGLTLFTLRQASATAGTRQDELRS